MQTIYNPGVRYVVLNGTKETNLMFQNKTNRIKDVSDSITERVYNDVRNTAADIMDKYPNLTGNYKTSDELADKFTQVLNYMGWHNLSCFWFNVSTKYEEAVAKLLTGYLLLGDTERLDTLISIQLDRQIQLNTTINEVGASPETVVKAILMVESLSEPNANDVFRISIYEGEQHFGIIKLDTDRYQMTIKDALAPKTIALLDKSIDVTSASVALELYLNKTRGFKTEFYPRDGDKYLVMYEGKDCVVYFEETYDIVNAMRPDGSCKAIFK